jgi:hypothetical protein
MTQPDLLAAAARPDCDEATLVELGRISGEARDFSQSLPIFVRHLSYPRATNPTFGDVKWELLESRAVSSFIPVLGSLSLLMEEHAESRHLLASAAPDIWLWLGRWMGVALSHLSDTPYRSGEFTFLDMFSGVLELITCTELIVPETVDVVVTLFCLGARSSELRGRVNTVMNTVKLPRPGHRGIGSSDEGLFICISYLLEPRPGWNGGLVCDRVLTLSEDIISHIFIHLDLLLSLHDSNKRSWKQTTQSAETLLSILLRVMTYSESFLSSLSEPIHVTILTHVLGLCDRIVMRNSNLGSKEDIVSIACHILRAVFSAQSSSLSLTALLSLAVDKQMFPFLCAAAAPSEHDGHSFKAEGMGDLARFLMENIVFARMFLPKVYAHLRHYTAVGSSVDPRGQELLGRWSSEYDVFSAQLADQRRLACSHSQVSGYVAFRALVLTEPVSAQGFFWSGSLLPGLSG